MALAAARSMSRTLKGRKATVFVFGQKVLPVDGGRKIGNAGNGFVKLTERAANADFLMRDERFHCLTIPLHQVAQLVIEVNNELNSQ